MKNHLSVSTNNDLLLKKVTYDETLFSSVIKEEPPDTEKFDSLSSSDKYPLTEAKIDDYFICSMKLLKWHSLHEKCPYSEFLWSIFSRIRTECREIRSRKLRTGKTPNTVTLHAVVVPLSKVLYEFDRNICEIVIDLIEIYWCIKITVISTSSTHLNAVTWQYFSGLTLLTG